MNNEIFSYIGEPLNALNKELKIQDQRVVVLFSYVFNECINISNQLTDYNNRIEKLSYVMNDINDHISKIEFRLGKVDKKINNIVSVLSISQEQINNEETQTDNPTVFKKICKFIKYQSKRFWNMICKIWNKIYRFIFKFKIERDKEKERQKKLEEEKRKRIAQKEKIKQILKH
jgi:hypothetical protein